MKFIAFVGTEGGMPPEAVAEMNRDFPAYFEEMDRRGVRLAGRELTFPPTGVTVRVREGEALLTDGPYAETKEYIGGIDMLECVDLHEAIEVESKSPVARFLPFEIRPVGADFRVSERAAELETRDDSAGVPYLLMIWDTGHSGAASSEPGTTEECEAWRDDLAAHEALILGGTLGGPDTATTLRYADGVTSTRDGSFLRSEAAVIGLEAVRCRDREYAIEIAASHPLARFHAIEVRAFG